MESLSKFFDEYGDLFEQAFDLNENGDLVEKDADVVFETDALLHELIIESSVDILTELLWDMRRRRYPGDEETVENPFSSSMTNTGGMGVSSSPSWLGRAADAVGGAADAVGGAVSSAAGKARDLVTGRTPTTPYSGTIDPTTDYSNAKAGDPRLYQGMYSAFRNAGLSHAGATHMIGEVNRENGFDPNLMFGTHLDPYNNAINGGVISWQGDRGNALRQNLQQAGVMDQNGNMTRSQAALDAQARFMVGEKGFPMQQMSDPNIDRNTATNLMGKFIGWRINDPKYHDAGMRNIDAGYKAAQNYIGNDPDQKTQVAGNQTPSGSRFSTGNADMTNMNPDNFRPAGSTQPSTQTQYAAADKPPPTTTPTPTPSPTQQAAVVPPTPPDQPQQVAAAAPLTPPPTPPAMPPAQTASNEDERMVDR